ncbi:hypothetical protein CN692_12070 [Bacillus sp. AFS002410]|uniref:S8 family serine peptidase n=1 Tax=Bacillus sp. AFS002410 TaxID=2033481 RepID=UPI000BEFE77D|nr:S8 family serine peptidase [Bacillus sp. AFS002410]PEJ57619.1 hypothetical protein CN692_12070 [Bacillus sp. AFS002410]
MKKKFIKLSIIAVLTTSSLSALNFRAPSRVHATTLNTESILAKLTPEQRKSLQQLSIVEQSGLHLDSSVDLESEKEVSVIVQFKHKPDKVAVLQSALQGERLSETQAKKDVTADHEAFKKDLMNAFKVHGKKKIASFEIEQTYKHTFNGLALKIPANMIKTLQKSEAVQAVYSNVQMQIEPPSIETEDTQLANSPKMDEEDSFLGLKQLHAEGYTGKGVKVAVIDTGIDYNHPDLQAAYKGGYDFVDHDNDPMETTYSDWKKSGKPEINGGITYYTEHGTHVSGIIAGRGTNDSDYATTGVAPDADLYVYRVLGPYGSGSMENVLAGIDKAVSDSVDVMNLSLGSNDSDPLFPTSIAVNNAVLSGVTVVVAAGNSGSSAYTLGSPGTAALALTVGASNTPFKIDTFKGCIENVSADLRLMAKNYADYISTLNGQTLPIVDVGSGNLPYYNGKDVKGKVVIANNNQYSLDSIIQNAKQNGAAAVLIYSLIKGQGHIQSYLGEGKNYLPAFSLSNSDGTAILQKIRAGYTYFNFGEMGQIQAQGDFLADFSSRGPSRVNYDIKPEITAPGVGVMSTVPFYKNNPDNPSDYKYSYERLSGTSMATPNVSGIAALLLQANSKLKPNDIKAILMNTAHPLSNPYSVFDVGAGRVDPLMAIHSSIEIKVSEKTPMMIHDKVNQIKEETGALSFGTKLFNNKDIVDNRSVKIDNNGVVAKTFDVSVKFQTDVRGSKDGEKNGVKLATDPSFTILANRSVNKNVSLIQ